MQLLGANMEVEAIPQAAELARERIQLEVLEPLGEWMKVYRQIAVRRGQCPKFPEFEIPLSCQCHAWATTACILTDSMHSAAIQNTCQALSRRHLPWCSCRLAQGPNSSLPYSALCPSL